MSVQLADLGLDRLSVAEKLNLIETLWDSLPEQLEPKEVPDWHLAVLAQRRAEMNANPGAGKPWREILSQLEARP